MHTSCRVDKLPKFMDSTTNAIENMAMHPYGVTAFNALIPLELVPSLMVASCAFMAGCHQISERLIKYVPLIDSKRYLMR